MPKKEQKRRAIKKTSFPAQSTSSLPKTSLPFNRVTPAALIEKLGPENPSQPTPPVPAPTTPPSLPGAASQAKGLASSPLLIPLSIILAGFLIGAGIFLNNFYQTAKTRSPNAPPGQALTQRPSRQANLARSVAPVSGQDHIRGNIDAKVVLVEFSDLDCPFCKQVHPTFQAIMSTYKPGEVAWVYRHFPIPSLHPNATLKAVAAECAGKLAGEDGFWNFVDGYFTQQDPRAAEEELVALARELKLDTKKFQTCLSGDEFDQKIESHVADGSAAGGTGTPYTVMISQNNFVPISGAAALQKFKAEIDKLLKQ